MKPILRDVEIPASLGTSESMNVCAGEHVTRRGNNL